MQNALTTDNPSEAQGSQVPFAHYLRKEKKVRFMMKRKDINLQNNLHIDILRDYK